MNFKFLGRSIITSLISLLAICKLSAQNIVGVADLNSNRINSIRTAVPFLLITPDARSSGMGEVSVALSPDANSIYNNPSKLAFMGQPSGFSLSYSPWLKSISSGVSLCYLSGYYKVDENSAIGASMRYFSYGKIDLTDINQQDLGTYNPNEFAADLTYARRFGETFSLGTTVRYIYSNLASGQSSTGQNIRPGKSLAADVSAFYKKASFLLGYDAIISAGINVSNIGTKMSYSDAAESYFLPANLKIGGSSTFIIDDYNELTLAMDFNKLLVPTQPIYFTDGSIQSGKNPDLSVPSGIFGSFNDAPGGFSEEIKEINLSTGIEYWYNKSFALRTGYCYESPKKGDRRYFTVGMGIKYESFNLDVSYLLANTQKSSLANTLKFTLMFNFGELEE